jgi:hypothetical protein
MATKNQKGAEEEKAIVPAGEAGLPAVLEGYRFDAKSLAVLRENVQDDITPFDLDKIKVPAGGGLSWEIPTIGKPISTQEITGVIVYYRNTRAYWDSDYNGEKTPPTCSSDNAKTGIGDPGGNCVTCPLSKFGSSQNPKSPDSQACKAIILLFVMVPGKSLPFVIPVPPTSTGIIKKHFLRMANEDIPYYRAIQSLSLTKVKQSKGAIEYSQIVPQVVEILPESFDEKVRELQAGFSAVFAKTNISTDDIT